MYTGPVLNARASLWSSLTSNYRWKHLRKISQKVPCFENNIQDVPEMTKKKDFSGFSPSQQPGLCWFSKSSWTLAAHSHYHHCFYMHFSLQRLAWDIHILCPVNIHELGGNFILTHIKTVCTRSAMSVPNERQLPCVVSNPTITWCETFISSVSAQSCICLSELVLWEKLLIKLKHL